MFISKTNYLKFSLIIFGLIINNTVICTKSLSLKYAKDKTAPYSLTQNFLSYLKMLFNTNTFIETGTYLGNTAKRAAKIFDQVETVELSKNIYEKAKAFLSAEKNVRCYFGDSAELLKPMIQKAKGNILFWLDGHYMNAENAGKGKSTSPIIEELRLIKQMNIKNSVILIDDIRLFDEVVTKADIPEVGGYPTIAEILPLLLEINPKYKIVAFGDILLAFEDKAIVVSKALDAMTLMRFHPHVSLNKLIEAGNMIAASEGEELDAIVTLYNGFCIHRYHLPFYKKYGAASHYALWYSLTLLNNDKQKALKILNELPYINLSRTYIDNLIKNLKV